MVKRRSESKLGRVMTSLMVLGLVVACRSVSEHEPDSEPKLEVDDRLTPETRGLVDVSAKVEAFVNRGIDQVRGQYQGDLSLVRKDFSNFAAAISKVLTEPRKKSGIVVAGFTIVPYTEVEAWARESLQPEQNEVMIIPFDQSRYKDNPVGLYSGRVPSHKLRSLADFTVGPVIKLHQTLVGVDKLSHFFEQGFWYFDAQLNPAERRAFGQYMEGDQALAKEEHPKYASIFKRYCRACNKFGYYGSEASGVISFADMEANESGFAFYKKLKQDPLGYRFRVNDYPYTKWNEVNTPSQFAHDVTREE